MPANEYHVYVYHATPTRSREQSNSNMRVKCVRAHRQLTCHACQLWRYYGNELDFRANGHWGAKRLLVLYNI